MIMLLLEFSLLFSFPLTCTFFGPDWLQQVLTLKLFLLCSLRYFSESVLASLSVVLFVFTLIV